MSAAGALKIRVSSDIDEAAKLWAGLWPENDVFGCWKIRRCFQESFNRPLHLLVAERGGRACGFLALSYIEEEDYFGAFPGETWNGRTWLEQNIIPSPSAEVTGALWKEVPENTTVRYVTPSCAADIEGAGIDETGYLFRPGDYGWNFDEYLKAFSGKSRKRLNREIESIGDIKIRPSVRVAEDIDWMLGVNIAGFGKMSYFADSRFTRGFEAMISQLSSSGMLRVTTATVGGIRAAVDVGAVHNSRYTVLAGAASPEFPGIAKAINFHHIRVSCREKFRQTDFLCGDFGWKRRFHLTARPLYIISTQADGRETAAANGRVEICA